MIFFEEKTLNYCSRRSKKSSSTYNNVFVNSMIIKLSITRKTRTTIPTTAKSQLNLFIFLKGKSLDFTSGEKRATRCYYTLKRQSLRMISSWVCQRAATNDYILI